MMISVEGQGGRGLEVVNICSIDWIRGIVSAYLVPVEGVILEGMRMVVFGRL